jgi:hypothetical protein
VSFAFYSTRAVRNHKKRSEKEQKGNCNEKSFVFLTDDGEGFRGVNADEIVEATFGYSGEILVANDE